MKRIGDIRKDILVSFGLDVSHERVRRYHNQKLFSMGRNPEGEYREFDDDQYEDAKTKILLAEIGVPLKDVKMGNAKIAKDRVYGVERICLYLKPKFRI